MTKAPRHAKSPVPLIAGAKGEGSETAPKRSAPAAGETSRADDRPAATEDTADYLAEISAELARLARSSGLDLVAYLLEMSAEEARKHGRAGAEAAR
jgi:hypothetical protein